MNTSNKARRIPLLVLGLLAGLSIDVSASSQATITRLLPEAAEAGDLLIIEGTNLGGTVSVDFQAVVGGFTGFLTRSATPLTTSATRVTVQVPLINAFAPPSAVPPGSPFGSLSLMDLNGRQSGPASFYYMEATSGSITTVGNGTTQPGNLGRPVVGFTFAGGDPIPGNSSFTATLGNALPNTLGLIVLALPATPPYAMIGDGTIVVDTGTVLGFLIQPVDAQGGSQLNLPVPGVNLQTTVMLQWAVLSTSGPFVSNGLQFEL